MSSTNDWAREYISAGGTLPRAFLADEQTAGRGQRTKIWNSPIGWTYLTIAVASPKGPAIKMPLKIAEVVCDVLVDRYGHQREGSGGESNAQTADNKSASLPGLSEGFWVKPPNDVYREKEKVAGILVEQTKDALIIGIGIDYPPSEVAEQLIRKVEGQLISQL